MQVAPYHDQYDDRRSSTDYPETSHHHHREHRPSNADYYDEPARSRSRGSGHRGSIDGEKDRGHGSSVSHHSGAKDIGASLLGAAVGGFAGHELGHGGAATLIGAVAGGVVGHKLESRHEKHKEERERERRGNEEDYRRYPEGPYADDGDGHSRSLSRGGRSDSGSEGDSDDSYKRRHHHHHHHH
jgi:hypothetical protein